jgi:hypothetical protein
MIRKKRKGKFCFEKSKQRGNLQREGDEEALLYCKEKTH